MRTVKNWRGQLLNCKFEWPEDCFLQFGGDGMVFTENTFSQALHDPKVAIDALTGKLPHYKTAFFEAFPENPKTFIRGEGETPEKAEEDCWNQWQKILLCENHEFEKRKYTNGYGICKHCELGMSNKFPVEENDEIKTNRA